MSFQATGNKTKMQLIELYHCINLFQLKETLSSWLQEDATPARRKTLINQLLIQATTVIIFVKYGTGRKIKQEQNNQFVKEIRYQNKVFMLLELRFELLYCKLEVYTKFFPTTQIFKKEKPKTSLHSCISSLSNTPNIQGTENIYRQIIGKKSYMNNSNKN